MTGPSDGTDATPQRASSDAIDTVLERFEAYVDDVTTRLEHAEPAGTIREHTREDVDRMIEQSRQRIRSSNDLAEAQEWFRRFEQQVQSWRP